MVRVDINNWYRLEGYIVPTNEYKYNPPINSLMGYDIWYTNVEVQLQNPTIGNFIHGVRYKTMKFSELGYDTIEKINTNFNTAIASMRSEMFSTSGALTYTTPFTIKESSVICFDDAYSDNLSRYIVILKDDFLTPNITGITASYDGPSVPMGNVFSHDYLNVTGHFEDGHTSKFEDGTYTIINSDGTNTPVIKTVGSNLFTASVVYGENEWKASFVVPGVKRLASITVSYDGPAIAIGKKPQRRNVVVVANYSDCSASTVTDWEYLNGDTITETNKGVLDIYYQGYETTVTINNYTASAAQIKAYYNGPKVEVGKNIILNYLTVRIFYKDITGTNSYWEVLEQSYYNIDNTLISFEGNNIINVSYSTNDGTILNTNFIVTGFEPEKEILYITAEYTGPPIVIGKTYSSHKVICKVYWSDGNVSLVTNFNVTTTLINLVGANEITVSYKNNNATFVITGITVENTTDNGYNPTEVNLLYPEATRINHRRRGPMESRKFDDYNKFLYENISNLFYIYSELERAFDVMNANKSSLYNTGTNTLNQCSIIEDRIKSIKEL